MENVSTQVFSGQTLASGGSTTSQIFSAALAVRGNRVLFSLLIIAASAATTSFQLEGSYDGKNWLKLGTAITSNTVGFSTASFGEGNMTQILDHAFFRINASVSAGTIIFDGYVVFSAQ